MIVSGQRAWSGGQPVLWSELVKRVFLFNLEWEFLLYWGVVVGVRAWVLHHAVQERELAASRLRAQLAEAELDAMQEQLQPHFVHNALHAISALMFRDVNAADDMIERLGRFLRATMEKNSRRLVTLEEELELAGDYLDIQQVRFGSELRLETHVPEDLRSVQVPPLLLQPLVENAVKHGFADSRGGTIRVQARRSGARVVVSVDDSGRGLAGAEGVREGIGLRITRARLQRLYPDSRLEIGASLLGGTRVVLSFSSPSTPAAVDNQELPHTA
jgi:LytS/YehU family sensor histidine kinase